MSAKQCPKCGFYGWGDCQYCARTERDEWKSRAEAAEADERTTRDSERRRILTALISFLEDDGGTFRKFISILGMDYTSAYDEGWMQFTNALADHESNILAVETDRASALQAEVARTKRTATESALRWAKRNCSFVEMGNEFVTRGLAALLGEAPHA